MHRSVRAVRTLVALASLVVTGQRELRGQDTGAPRNPLQGLARPDLPRVDVHDTTFCSFAALQAWLTGVVAPQLQELDRAIGAVREYGDNVSIRLAALQHYPPGDAGVENALKADSKWADSALDRLEKQKSALLEAVRNSRVIDCGSHVAAPRDSTRPSGTAGLTRPDIRYLNVRDTAFCTEAERQAWLGVVFSVLQQIDRAMRAVDAYDDNLSARLAAVQHYEPVDAGDVNTLKAESKWARDKLDELEKAKKAALEKAKNAKVIDCGPHVAVPHDSVPPSVGDSAPQPKRRPAAVPGAQPQPRGVFIGAGFGVDRFTNLTSTVGAATNVASATAKQTTTAFALRGGWDVTPRVRFDASWRANTVSYEQALTTGQTSSGTVDGQFVNLALGLLGHRSRKSDIYFLFGGVVAIDHLKFTPIPSPGGNATSTRSLNTLKGLLGGELDYRITRNTALTVGASLTSGWAIHDGDRVARGDVGFKCNLGRPSF